MNRLAFLALVLLTACDGCDDDDAPPPPPRPTSQAEADEAQLKRLSAIADQAKPAGPAERDVGAWRAYADALAAVKRVDEAIKAYDRCAFEGERTIQSAGDTTVADEVVDHAMYCSAAAVLGRQILKTKQEAPKTP